MTTNLKDHDEVPVKALVDLLICVGIDYDQHGKQVLVNRDHLTCVLMWLQSQVPDLAI